MLLAAASIILSYQLVSRRGGLVASVVLELVLDFGAGAVAVVLAPYVGDWVYGVAGVIVAGSLPVLSLNVARVASREWGRHST
jgi:hypothetical protein